MHQANGVEISMLKKCEDCVQFAPAINTVSLYSNNEVVAKNHVVICEHREVCDYLERKFVSTDAGEDVE